jgi:hypothetical protein
MWEAIEQTAARIEREWSRAGYRREVFPELAASEVATLLAGDALDLDGILASLAGAAQWCEPLDPYTQFGEPAVTLYKTERWNLDVYFWLHPLTALHDHRFCGAFGVVEGLTLNSTYAFEPREPMPRGVEHGSLVRLGCELLRPGSVRRILPGRAFIHQVLHLTRPSVSVALRTTREPDLPFQREYLWPGLSVPGLQHLSHSQRRKLELIGTLVALRRADATALIARMLDGEDEMCAFWMLYRLFHAAGLRPEALVPVLDASQATIGRHREALLRSLAGTAEAAPYWNAAREEPQRLLVALATSLEDADEILRLVEEYGAGEAPAAAIPKWLAGMRREELSQRALASLGRHAAPLARLDLSPRSLLLLRGILEREDRDAVLRRARSEDADAAPGALERELEELEQRIARVPLLRPFVERWKQRLREA